MVLRERNPTRRAVRLFSNDSICNLRVRVTLKKSRDQSDTVRNTSYTDKSLALEYKRQQKKHKQKLSAKLKLISNNVSSPNESNNQIDTTSLLPILNEVVLDQTFSWQRKVNSAREILFLCHSKHKKRNHLDSQYEFDIRKLLKCVNEDPEAASRSYILAQSGAMLASMIDVDDYIHESMLEENVTTSSQRELNPLAKSIGRIEGSKMRSQKASERNYQSMTVLACVDLPDNESSMKHLKHTETIGNEIILYRIQYDHSQSFVIEPPFNGPPDSSESYEFCSPDGVWYDYWIENVSEGSKTERQKTLNEKRKEREQQTRKQELRKNLFNGRIEKLPASNQIQLNVFGEIVRASHVNASEIYVIYELALPEGWQWSSNDPHRRLSSITPVSQSIVYTHERESLRFAHFSSPLQFELRGRRDSPLFRWPTLFTQVNSYDIWGRHRVEGYGYVEIPSQPGHHELIIRLWRPTGTPADICKDFFLGNVPSLQNIKQSGLAPDFQKRFHARYGFCTRDAGELHIRLNTILSTGKIIDEDGEAKAAAARVATTELKTTLMLRAGNEATKKQAQILRAIEHLRLSAHHDDNDNTESENKGSNANRSSGASG